MINYRGRRESLSNIFANAPKYIIDNVNAERRSRGMSLIQHEGLSDDDERQRERQRSFNNEHRLLERIQLARAEAKLVELRKYLSK